MENDERISRIQSFGYNVTEASFLCAAALHGGFFLRRQYAAFTGKVAGYADVALSEKALKFGHVKVTAMRHNRMLYHLCSIGRWARRTTATGVIVSRKRLSVD